MPTPHTTFLSAFADALAERLPGTWTSEYHRHAAYRNQFPTVERPWDTGHVDYIVSQYVLGHDAVLNGPHGQQLYVTDRPLHRHQFVVAPLEPTGFQPHQISPVREPNGIAVPNDPVRAGAAVARRLLPRYQQALAAVRDNASHLPNAVPHPARSPKRSCSPGTGTEPSPPRTTVCPPRSARSCTATVSSTAPAAASSSCPPSLPELMRDSHGSRPSHAGSPITASA
ncbi:hypothetical protein AB0I77_15195 [Streptomyces sp. NPDC050619]|uniref:hypothetical protein n=1 Tax=Streptomyces sp. NPDC050619 TaxID=3157214 RepID=UPI003445D3F8